MTNLNHLYQLCENLGCSALYNEPLYKHTSFKIGGPSDLFINVKDVSSLSQILKYISDNNIPFSLSEMAQIFWFLMPVLEVLFCIFREISLIYLLRMKKLYYKVRSRSYPC